MAERSPDKPEHFYDQSAVIPYRRQDGDVQVLLITSSGGSKWIIPKGVIEPDHTPFESAAKEAEEEAGVRGRVSTIAVGEYRYEKWGGELEVAVYLLHVDEELEDWDESDVRERQWLSCAEAAEQVSIDALRDILRELPTLVEGL